MHSGTCRRCRGVAFLFIGLVLPFFLFAQVIPPPPTKQPGVARGKDGRLVYVADSLGHRVPDFSYCGYAAAEKAIPDVPVKVVVPLKTGDATLRIQAAIDYVAGLPAGTDGLRGAVLLQKGVYEVSGPLTLSHSGVVLRGSGMNEGGTVLFATGQDRDIFIRVFNNAPDKTEPGLSQIGIENLRCRSAYDSNNPKDEAHRWTAVSLENVSDAWVRQIVFEHFAGSAVSVLEKARRITVEDCKSLSPVSEIGGGRRNSFYTLGRQILFQRLYAEEGYHDFAVGYNTEGPNAFVQCESHLPYGYSGTVEKTANNVLFDLVNVDGNALGFPYNSLSQKEAGPGVSNGVLWQCSAARVDCFAPRGASNWAFGIWAEFAGNGNWAASNEHIQPRSLYYGQLADRLGSGAAERATLMFWEFGPTSPTVAEAAVFIAKARQPLESLSQWIDKAAERQPIPVTADGVKTIDGIGYAKAASTKKNLIPTTITNGRLMRDGQLLAGSRHHIWYWKGNTTPSGIKAAVPHLTRFVPGRTGTGLTDDLNEVARWMQAAHILSIDHNYGLWYDRRRDDHERFRRMDGNVQPPFYELPFARSGRGTAWDGLSKYDLMEYNPWYWSRLKQFADLADEKGLVLLHQNYFQHNIIEAGAHYADFPWRTANNINHTPFPEPVPYAGDKRIFMAEQFYDVGNTAYRNLHKAYIRKCLDNFSGNTGVIQLIGAEYTGPLHFVQFWLDEIKAWEKETGKKEIIGLSTTKDVQDSILTDKDRAPLINLIDIRFWHYQRAGTVYAPKGGQNLAPRQHARQLKPDSTSFAQVYRAVAEYRQKYPDKAVTFTPEEDESNPFGWAVLLAGGSLPSVPPVEATGFFAGVAQMQPIDNQPQGQYAMTDGGSFIVYADAAISSVVLNPASAAKSFTLIWIDPSTGKTIKQEKMKKGNLLSVKKPVAGDVVLWLKSSSK